jgi:hypothetical protein
MQLCAGVLAASPVSEVEEGRSQRPPHVPKFNRSETMMKIAMISAAAIAVMCCAVTTASAGPGCGRNQVYSSSMGQCIPKSLMCNANQIYSSSMARCIPKKLMQ